jgi:hypothetical protein
VNTSLKAEEDLKRHNKEKDGILADTVNRLKGRRDKLTKHSDGRYPGGFVEEMTVLCLHVVN